MAQGHVIVEGSAQPLATIAAALERVRDRLDPDTPASLYLAATADPGRLPARGQPGLTLVIPAGSLLVGLALAHDSVLLDTPADRVLNRNVRGLLRGLGAQYFGTEHLVVAGQPAAWVGYDHDEGGRLLVIAVIGIEAPLATEPATSLRGRAWASLRELGERGSIADLCARVIAGYRRLGLEPA
jgi:hypothetical protein